MWGINATVHFNSWADMGTNDFTDVRNAHFALTQLFKCGTCNTLLHVIPTKGNSESLKCDCGQRTYTSLADQTRSLYLVLLGCVLAKQWLAMTPLTPVFKDIECKCGEAMKVKASRVMSNTKFSRV